MDSRALSHSFAPKALSVHNWKARRFRWSDSQMSPSKSTTIHSTSHCMAEMTTNCCSPRRHPKQCSCRILFAACASQRLEELPKSADCYCGMRTAERVNSPRAAGIPSGKSCRRGQHPEPDSKYHSSDWYTTPYSIGAILDTALNPFSRPIV